MTTRVSVTLPIGHYGELQNLAANQKVSLAWMVRDAVEKYLLVQEKEGRISRKPKQQR